MALLNVNPTRMELMNLKRKLKNAVRGHKLLKDKQDGLMKTFMTIIRQTRDMRRVVENKLGNAFDSMALASAMMYPEMLKLALRSSQVQTNLGVSTKNVMGVRVPEFKAETKGDPINYGFAQTSGDLELALKKLNDCFAELLQLAELEKTAENLAIEIEKTRRRVNALEYSMIPDQKETIKFIQMKLDESARSGVVQIMQLKARLEAEEAELARLAKTS